MIDLAPGSAAWRTAEAAIAHMVEHPSGEPWVRRADNVTFTRSGKQRDGTAVYAGRDPAGRIAQIYWLTHGAGGGWAVGSGQSCLFRDHEPVPSAADRARKGAKVPSRVAERTSGGVPGLPARP